MILAIVGPTGVGKTKLSIELAKKYKAIIINADAMQVYKDMNIGTAKIRKEEMEGVPHFLLDFVNLDINYTVYNYQKDARRILKDYSDRNIIFVGGSGLYLKSTLYHYVFEDEEKENLTYDEYSNDELFELAKKKDSNMNIHPNNRKRLIRFLNKENTNISECYPLYDCLYIGLSTDREVLYARINKRVDEMFEEGLVEEARKLYKENGNSKALGTAIGYKELFAYFDGKISIEEAKELIKKNSRHYAKRQYTWFKNQMDINWFNVDFNNFNKTTREVINFINKSK